jgi:hypothetical protein
MVSYILRRPYESLAKEGRDKRRVLSDEPRVEANNGDSSTGGSTESSAGPRDAGRGFGRGSHQAEFELGPRVVGMDEAGRRGHYFAERASEGTDQVPLVGPGYVREPFHAERRLVLHGLLLLCVVGLAIAAVQGRDVMNLVMLIAGGLLGYYFGDS